MKATQILSSEHRVIETMLDVLAKIAEEAEQTGKLNKETAGEAIDFIKTFADGCHHHKEEDILFPSMVDRGMSAEHGPIGIMLHEHELGRFHVRQMVAALDQASAGDRGAIESFASHAGGYITLLRAHIMKEDNILFPMANRLMANDAETILEKFQSVEHDHMGVGTHERYLSIAEKLADRYGVSFEPMAQQAASCGCHHHGTQR